MRFVKNAMLHNNFTKARRDGSAGGQKSLVTIIGCSDSWVPVEEIFDACICEIFTIRLAGNVSGTYAIGTAEYGTEHLGTPILVVPWHSSYGAVTAVVKGAKLERNIPFPVKNIFEPVERVKKKIKNVSEQELLRLSTIKNIFQHNYLSR